MPARIGYIIRAKLSFFYEFSKLKAVNPIFLLFFNKSVNIRAIEGFFLQASPPALPHSEGALQAERKRGKNIII